MRRLFAGLLGSSLLVVRSLPLGGWTVHDPKGGEDQFFEPKLIINPHARFPLPGWIGKTLAEIETDFRRITSA